MSVFNIAEFLWLIAVVALRFNVEEPRAIANRNLKNCLEVIILVAI